MSAPTKIYYDDFAGTVNREWMVGDTVYVRADIVDELVEALKECLKVNGYANAREMINAALKKLEESHE